MKKKLEATNEIIKDIINLLEQNLNETDFVHVDNLIEEIENEPAQFGYSFEEFKDTFNTIFNSKLL